MTEIRTNQKDMQEKISEMDQKINLLMDKNGVELNTPDPRADRKRLKERLMKSMMASEKPANGWKESIFGIQPADHRLGNQGSRSS